MHVWLLFGFCVGRKALVTVVRKWLMLLFHPFSAPKVSVTQAIKKLFFLPCFAASRSVVHDPFLIRWTLSLISSFWRISCNNYEWLSMCREIRKCMVSQLSFSLHLSLSSERSFAFELSRSVRAIFRLTWWISYILYYKNAPVVDTQQAKYLRKTLYSKAHMLPSFLL